ncbi:MAG: (deoxy)nucleoside triphosphate pyrophosphohydrolase [Candidatus Phosphoribacter sp.]|nr:(deoxy)nucleoside triphosphate pyrophosphohydrolase [Actinomycetales bacterium]
MAPTGRPGCPQVVVAAAVVDELAAPTRLLAARRSAPPEHAGGWELPGGKVEQGETQEAAVHREVREELGIELRLGSPVEGPLPGGGWPIGVDGTLRVWLAQVSGDGIPEALEDHDALRWLTPTTLLSVPWLPADLPVVQALAMLLVGAPNKP